MPQDHLTLTGVLRAGPAHFRLHNTYHPARGSWPPVVGLEVAVGGASGAVFRLRAHAGSRDAGALAAAAALLAKLDAAYARRKTERAREDVDRDRRRVRFFIRAVESGWPPQF